MWPKDIDLHQRSHSKHLPAQRVPYVSEYCSDEDAMSDVDTHQVRCFIVSMLNASADLCSKQWIENEQMAYSPEDPEHGHVHRSPTPGLPTPDRRRHHSPTPDHRHHHSPASVFDDDPQDKDARRDKGEERGRKQSLGVTRGTSRVSSWSPSPPPPFRKLAPPSKPPHNRSSDRTHSRTSAPKHNRSPSHRNSPRLKSRTPSRSNHANLRNPGREHGRERGRERSRERGRERGRERSRSRSESSDQSRRRVSPTAPCRKRRVCSPRRQRSRAISIGSSPPQRSTRPSSSQIPTAKVSSAKQDLPDVKVLRCRAPAAESLKKGGNGAKQAFEVSAHHLPIFAY